jgi:hypothetical protein
MPDIKKIAQSIKRHLQIRTKSRWEYGNSKDDAKNSILSTTGVTPVDVFENDATTQSEPIIQFYATKKDNYAGGTNESTIRLILGFGTGVPEHPIAIYDEGLQEEINNIERATLGESDYGHYSASTTTGDYSIVSGATSLIDAVKKIDQYVDDSNYDETGGNYKYIYHINQKNGRISADTRSIKDGVLTGYVQPTDHPISINGTDTIESAFKKIDSYIGDLEFEVSGGSDKYVYYVKQTNGKVSATTRSVKDGLLTGYSKPTDHPINISETDTIEGALKKIDDYVGKSDFKVDGSDYQYVYYVEQTDGRVSAKVKSIKDGKIYNYGGSKSPVNIESTDTIEEVIDKFNRYLNSLDISSGESGSFISGVTQTDGLVSVKLGKIIDAKLLNYANNSSSGDIENNDSIETAFSKLENNIDSIEEAFSELQNETDTIETSVGLNSDGSYSKTSTKHSSGATTTKGAIEAIDTYITSLNDSENKSGTVVTTVSQADGHVSHDRAYLPNIILTGYDKSADSGAVTAFDSLEKAISKLENNTTSISNRAVLGVKLNNKSIVSNQIANFYTTSSGDTHNVTFTEANGSIGGDVSNYICGDYA